MSSPPPSIRSRLWRWTRRILVGLGCLIVLAVLIGASYEQWARRKAHREFPPPGKLVDIDGRRIQLDCRGTGSPIVVFEAGLDMNGSLAWNLVHDSVAATTRACAYSRAGIMWSDPHRGAHDAMAVAGDLHAALSAAGERPPYVLVGHSLGGPYIVTYTKRYGDDVAGLVFVDASHPDQVRRMRELLGRELNPPMGIIKAAAALSWTGVLRAVPRPIPPHWPVEAARAAAAYVPTSLGSMLEEGDALDTTLAQAGELRNLGDRPIVVLTAMAPMDSSILASLEIDRAKGEEFQALWRSLHDEEASWSTRSQHQVLTDATHYVQFDRPDAVIAAVRSVVDSVRLKP